MKINVTLCLILIAGLIGISGCVSKDKELKKDAKEIAEVMCKTIEAMKKLKMVEPSDSQAVNKLQLEYENIQAEMATVYKAFNIKYGDKTRSDEFNEKFRKYLDKSMLDCKNLSKEDRKVFEKSTK